MNNLNNAKFMELSMNDLQMIEGGKGFWSTVKSYVSDFFKGFGDAMSDFSLPM